MGWGYDDEEEPEDDEDFVGVVPEWAWDDTGRLLPIIADLWLTPEEFEAQDSPRDDFDFDCDGYILALDAQASAV